MKTLSEQYLASLPSINRKETYKDSGIRAKKGLHRKDMYKAKRKELDIIWKGDDLGIGKTQ